MDRRKFVTGASAFGLGGLLTAPKAALGKAGPDVRLDAVIVGGGASGLAAAWLLKDHDIRVLEAEPVLGGRTISGQWNGFRYAKGSEYIGKPEGALADWIDDLGLEPVPIPPPTGGVALDGQLWTGHDILGFMSDQDALDDYARLAALLEQLNGQGLEDAAAAGPAAMARFRDLDRLSVREWLHQEYIHPVVQEMVDVENRGLFGAANADLSLAWNVPEMSWNLHDPDEANQSSVYGFRLGMQEIISAAARGLGPSIVRTGARVERILLDGDDAYPVRIDYADTGGRHTIRSRACVLTVPAPIAAGIATDALRPATRKALSSVQYAPYVTVNLMLERRVLQDSWSVAALNEFFVTLYDAVRLQVPHDYDGPAVLGVYIPPKQASDRSLLALPDGAIVARVLEGLQKYVPEIRNIVVGHDVQRFPYAFPVFRPGYTEVLQALDQDAGAGGPVFLAGDYTAYATFDGAVQSAVQAVERLNRYF